jgi:hypothetical protein
MKCVNIIKYAKDLYTENSKTQMKNKSQTWEKEVNHVDGLDKI